MSVRETVFGSAVVLTAFALLTSGCGGEPEFAPQPGPPDGGVDAAPPPPPPVDAAPPPPPQPVACDAAQSLPLTTIFQARAAAEAPGMQPEGGVVCNVVPEGQTVSSPTFMLQPGYCYTVLGSALPTVSELEMQLELDLAGGGQVPPAIAALNIKPVLAVDTETGPQGAIASKKNCYSWTLLPIPVAVKLVLKPRTGSGPIAAQVYKKKR